MLNSTVFEAEQQLTTVLRPQPVNTARVDSTHQVVVHLVLRVFISTRLCLPESQPKTTLVFKKEYAYRCIEAKQPQEEHIFCFASVGV